MEQIGVLLWVVIVSAMAGAFRVIMGYASKDGETFDWRKFNKTLLYSVMAGIVFGLGTITNMPINPDLNYFVTLFLGIVVANYAAKDLIKLKEKDNTTPLNK